MSFQSCSLEDFKQANHPVAGWFQPIVEKLPPLSAKGPWFAGGTVRKFIQGCDSTKINDWDIFFASQEQLHSYAEMLVNLGAVLDSENIFNKTYTFEGNKIQLIHNAFSSTAIKTMETFDISVCQFAFDGTNLIWSEEGAESIKTMEFEFLKTPNPEYSIIRSYKYAREGFKPAHGEVLKVLRRVAGKPEVVRKKKKDGWVST